MAIIIIKKLNLVFFLSFYEHLKLVVELNKCLLLHQEISLQEIYY